MTDPLAIARGWSAADVHPSELVDDAWIAAHTTPGRAPSRVRHVAARARQLLSPSTPMSLQRQGFTRDQMRRIAARTGYPYIEAWSGWNRGAMAGVWGALIHHTGTAASAPGDYPTLKIVRDGRSDLQNSLCAFGLGRSGTTYLVSEKLSWHAGAGAWNGLTDGNGYLAGIEAESDGVQWTPEEIDAYPRLVASILVEVGQDDRYTTRHASYALPAGRKTDTGGLDMNAFWARVYGYLAHPEQIDRNWRPTPPPTPAPAPTPAPPLLEDAMLIATQLDVKDGPVTYAVLSGGVLTGLDPASAVSAQALTKAGVPVLWVSKNDWDELVRKSQLIAK